jgi:hypothetical protein
MLMLPKPEDRWAPGPFYLNVSIWATWPCKYTNILFQTLVEANGVCYFIARFCFFFCLSKFELGEFDFRERPAGPEAREKGRIVVEA